MKFFLRIALLLLALGLSACASNPSATRSRDYLPGGTQFYSFGVSQNKENFANIERAQSYYGLFTKQRSWQDIKPAKGYAYILSLQTYYPLDVRWKLKDGREFILEKIDVHSIMNEYFKTHDIKLPWQEEGRDQQRISDAHPTLVHEVKDDTVIIKWLIQTNRTPVTERFTSVGTATHWVREDEEFLVAAIQGKPTSGIDFEKWVEILK